MRDHGFIHLPRVPFSGQAETLLPSLGHPAALGVQGRLCHAGARAAEETRGTARAAAAPATAVRQAASWQCSSSS